jgi:polysaccharide pyruvyl transferase WcaK-like protein
MRILISNDTLSFPHHGCRATSTALRNLLGERFPGAVIESDATTAKSVLYFLPVKTAMWRVAAQAKGFCEPRPDLLVVNGEGTLHAMGRRLKRRNGGYVLRLLQAQRALELGVETWIVNHSLFFDRPDYQALLQEIYPRLAYAAVREPLSLENSRQLKDVEIALSADCAFLTPLPPPAESSPLADALVMTDSSLRWKAEEFHRLKECLAILQRRTGRKAVYLSIFTDGHDRGRADRLGVPYIAFEKTENYLAHLQRVKFLLSGRYHTAVFSALCGVPFVPLQANTPKNSGLLALLNYPVPCLNPQEQSGDEMARTVLELYEKAEGLSASLKARREELKRLARANLPPAPR